MPGKKLILLAASVFTMTLWGCGGNLDSGGDQTGGGSTLENALPVGINNCLTCHNPFSTLVQDYLISRHGNHMLVAAKLRPGEIYDNDPNDVLASPDDDDPRPGSCGSGRCHDPFDDGAIIDGLSMQQALTIAPDIDEAEYDWSTAGAIVGCEGCHGGGQFHNGIAAGIPYPVPGPRQCGLCHYLTDALAQNGLYGSVPHHDTSSNGNNVRRNILDSHYDDPATSYNSSELDPADPLFAANIVEGYAISYNTQTGCIDCHFNGHAFDLSKNYEWAASGHAGEIKTLKDEALAAGLPVPAPDGDAERLALLTAVTEAGPTDEAVFPHYDWDNTDGWGGASSRGSCQVCHTATGISNFLTDQASYDLSGAGNNFSHLVGWVNGVSSSGQNELLYCWGCHSGSSGTLRNPGAITLDYTYNTAVVTLTDVGNSNVCVKCHGGRGNNDSIRTGSRSSRFGGHHAPTAGSIFAALTHTGYEFESAPGVPLDHTNASFLHDEIDSPEDSGPCSSCHMGAAQNHTFSATVYASGKITHQPSSDPIATIRNQATCNGAVGCHIAMNAGALQTLKEGYEAAAAVLTSYVDNTIAGGNYLGLDIATTSNDNYRTVELNAYGAFQNNIYMGEEPCIYVHNPLYGKRLIFDSIDWMDNGALDGTVNLTGFAAAAAWLNGGVPGDITAVPRPTP